MITNLDVLLDAVAGGAVAALVCLCCGACVPTPKPEPRAAGLASSLPWVSIPSSSSLSARLLELFSLFLLANATSSITLWSDIKFTLFHHRFTEVVCSACFPVRYALVIPPK